MVVDGPRTVSHDPVGIVTGSKGWLLDVGLDHSLLLVIDRFDGNGDVISALVIFRLIIKSSLQLS